MRARPRPKRPTPDPVRLSSVLRAPVLALAAASLGTMAASGAEAQLVFGGHVVSAADAFGGTYGAGLRAGLDLPALPFDLMASGEYFFPDCPPALDDCGLRGVTLDANFRMVFPLVRPYLTGGLARRRTVEDDAEDASTGIALGAGVDVALGGVRAFGEARYEFVDAPEKQVVWRLGLLFGR